MPKGFTYFCTDSNGHTHNRYSAGHTAPIYTFASVVLRKDDQSCAKGDVCYSARRERAETVAASDRRYLAPGYVLGSYARAIEVVAVRAYAGKHSVEPVEAL